MVTDARDKPVPPVLAERRPVLTLLIAAFVGVIAAAGASRLSPSATMRDLLARDHGASVALNRIRDVFPVTDNLTLLVAVPPTDASDVDAVRRLVEFARSLESAIRSSATLSPLVVDVAYRADMPDAARVFVERHVVPNGLLYLTEEGFVEARRRLTGQAMVEQIARNARLIQVSSPAAGAIADAVLRDPLRLYELIDRDVGIDAAGVGPLVSPDGQSLLIRITGTYPADDLDFCRRLVDGVKDVVDRLDPQGLTVDYTGVYAIADLSARSIRRDMMISVAGSLVLIQILFLLAYRHVLSFPVVFVPVALGILTGFGVFSLFARSITPMTAVIGAVLAGIGIDFGIHLLSHCSAGHVSEAVRRMRPPIITAAVTSLLAFAAVAASSIPAIRDFGRLGGLGLLGAAVATLFVLPALIVLLGDRVVTLSPRWRPPVALGGRAAVIGLSLIWFVAVAVGVVGMDRVMAFETDLTVLHPRPNPALDLEAVIAQRFGTAPNAILVHIVADTEEAVTADVHAVRRRLLTKEGNRAGVASVHSIASLVPDPAVTPARLVAIAAIDAGRVLEDFRAAVADSPFNPAVYEDYEAFLDRLLDPGPAPTLATLREAVGPAGIGRLLPTADEGSIGESIVVARLGVPLNDRDRRNEAIATIRSLVADVPSATVTGLSVIGHDTEVQLRTALVRLLVVALGAVAVFLLIVFRSFRDAGLALLPVAFAVTCLPAIMMLTGDRFNMINLVGLPLLIGIAVDDGIMLVSIARRCRLSREAAEEQLSASSHAVIVTSLTTVLAFGTLMFTNTPAIQSLGRLTALGMVAALLASLFLLVPILVRMSRQP